MSVPKHVAIILDGNRRFAKRLMMKPWKGHEWGAKKIEKLFDWAKELDIKELTLYVFSIENFKRPKPEFNYLMNLFRKEFEKYYNNKKVEKNKIRMRFIGQIKLLPFDIQEKIRKLEEKTKKFSRYNINFAIAYGGRQEIIEAVRKLAGKVNDRKLRLSKINEKEFLKNLYLKSEPDLIIRTGGEQRLSGFLTFQSTYSELYFLKKMWPEFTKADLRKAIEVFEARKRRFGK